MAPSSVGDGTLTSPSGGDDAAPSRGEKPPTHWSWLTGHQPPTPRPGQALMEPLLDRPRPPPVGSPSEPVRGLPVTFTDTREGSSPPRCLPKPGEGLCPPMSQPGH
ncbi:Hypothetical predicted protein [Marmota monax]|uniref:Uncharacterized protein n=1 Tax=Marmota monax TaxID=9995 RepID=A0A5E4AAT8_MARMO|nr:hypothetical protein GHT09_000655 [Marmota monax]VTJ54284.1 Hypothetical predicted protein [Marmota monax]